MKQTAQGLAALGRGPDTELVHMAPSEVAGLQALAQKHGGSLTINPDTGLPEAGFLSSILPMVLGAGAMMIPGVGPLMAAGLVGGAYGLASGSLEKGLMAGLGAYGGAGLAGGLAAAAPAAEVAAGSIVPQAQGLAEIGTASAQAAGAGSPTLLNAAQQANTGFGSGFGAAFDPGATSAIYPTAPAPTVFSTAPPPQIALGPTPTPTPTFARMGAGLTDITSSGAKALDFAGKNVMPLGAMGLSALAGMQPDALNAPKEDEGLIRPYTYSREKIPGAFEDVAGAPMSSKERRYFTDQYTALTPYKAPGPEYMAAGGPVEAMSNANAIGANTGYPQADIRTGAYATPFQQPMSQNVVQGAQDAAVDPYTGQATFADGGSVGGYYYDQATGQYSGGTPIEEDRQGRGFSAILDKFRQRNSWMLPPEDNAAGSGPAQYANSSIGGYSFDPVTQQYTRAQPIAVPVAAGTNADQPRFMGFTGGFANDNNADSGGRANGGLLALAQGGMSNLGSYSDGGRLLRGPGDGVSDSIPAMIGQKQQARLADGEFVVPARIVSELGNGSTEAGARQLYAMMDRVQKARKKSIGKDKVATNSRAAKLLPA